MAETYELTGYADGGAVKSALDKAGTAVQPDDLAAVATSGAYADLTGKPTLGTAAATDSTAYATAAQGAKADTASQPGHAHTSANISDSTAAGRTLLTAADAAAQRTALGLGTAATTASTAYATAAQGAKADAALQPADKQIAISDFTPGRLAVVDYIPRPTIDQIAGLAPTLDLDFERQVYRHYSPSTGLREKALSDIVTFTRASEATYFDARGVLQTAGSNVPRLDFDPVTGVCKGLLIEESRTNLLTYSQEFDNAAWTKLNTAVTANAVIAPNGTLTAGKVTETTDSGQHFISYTGLQTTNATYTASVFVKKADYSTFSLQVVSTGSSSITSEVFFSISETACTVTGTTGLISAVAVNPVGSGWFRCSITYTLNGTVTNHQFRIFAKDISVYVGNTSSGIYVWGAQLEQGAFSTSYISTTTAAATRAADVAVISGTAFSDFYRQGVGTLYTVVPGFSYDGNYPFSMLSLTKANGADFIQLSRGHVSPANRFIANITAGGISQMYFNPGNFASGVPAKMGTAFAENNSAFSYNAALLEDATVSLPEVDRLFVGNNFWGVALSQGHISRATYWPARLPNATLRQMTAG